MYTGNYDNGILSAFCNVLSCLLGGLGSIIALGSMLLSFSFILCYHKTIDKLCLQPSVVY